MERIPHYHPLTSCPGMTEEIPPCPELRPYVRCFWRGVGTRQLLVVPDTCMDLLFVTEQGRATVRFCGLDDRAYLSAPAQGEIFGIRFYAWTAEAFADDGLGQTFCGAFAGEQHFTRLCRLLLPCMNSGDFAWKVHAAQRALLACLRPRENRLVGEAVATLLRHHGTLSTTALAGELHISTRQLEREMHNVVGVGPKRLSDLVRYQFLWQELLLDPRFQIQDAVQKYGFSDQAHLQNTFKRYHSMTPRQAVAYARAGCRNFTIQTSEAMLK